MEDRFLRYPFQHHLRVLEPQTVYDCVSGAVEAAGTRGQEPPATFADWVLATMGCGIAEHFMLPDNHQAVGYAPGGHERGLDR